MHPALRTLLGLNKLSLLFSALASREASPPPATLGAFSMAGAILIAALPLLSFYAGDSTIPLDYGTLLVGISACLAILYRIRARIPFLSVKTWRESLHLTHIAFALGCIPTLLVLFVWPQALFQLSAPPSATTGHATAPTVAHMVTTILGIATWAALTEEFIYRGMLVSVFRRWNAIRSPRIRDVVAVLVSASIFGLAHLPSWGPAMSFALFGLGVGFAVAYIAIGEVLLPLIVYHILFDTLSLSFAIFARS